MVVAVSVTFQNFLGLTPSVGERSMATKASYDHLLSEVSGSRRQSTSSSISPPLLVENKLKLILTNFSSLDPQPRYNDENMIRFWEVLQRSRSSL